MSSVYQVLHSVYYGALFQVSGKVENPFKMTLKKKGQ